MTLEKSNAEILSHLNSPFDNIDANDIEIEKVTPSLDGQQQKILSLTTML